MALIRRWACLQRQGAPHRKPASENHRAPPPYTTAPRDPLKMAAPANKAIAAKTNLRCFVVESRKYPAAPMARIIAVTMYSSQAARAHKDGGGKGKHLVREWRKTVQVSQVREVPAQG